MIMLVNSDSALQSVGNLKSLIIILVLYKIFIRLLSLTKANRFEFNVKLGVIHC